MSECGCQSLFIGFESMNKSSTESVNKNQHILTPYPGTPEELSEGYLWIYKEFYSIKNIMRRIPENHKQRIPYFLFCFIYRKFGNITSKVAEVGLLAYLGKLARRLSYGID